MLQPASTAPDLVTAPVRRRRSGLPPALLVPAGLALAFLVLPLVALVLRAPWRSLPELLLTPQVGQALRLSLVCATSATVLCLLLGVPLAWVLARSELPGRRVVRALVTVPLVLPPVVGGVALLLLLGRRGLLGQYLDTGLGVTIPFTTGAVVIAEAFVAMPFLVIAGAAALLAQAFPNLTGAQIVALLHAAKCPRPVRLICPVFRVIGLTHKRFEFIPRAVAKTIFLDTEAILQPWQHAGRQGKRFGDDLVSPFAVKRTAVQRKVRMIDHLTSFGSGNRGY